MTLREQVQAAFAVNGPLSRAFAGYEPRAEQLEMALAVAEAMTMGSVLLTEAGTGTGKTLAYAVPAVLSRRSVIISTATKNLQDQIVERDLPRLASALGVELRVQCLKGRHNYVCLHRLGRANQQPGLRFSNMVGPLKMISEWATRTQTGDRAELRELPEDFSGWRDVDARSDICLGQRCPSYGECFVTKNRQAAATADIVVVNHHLYFADLALRVASKDASILPRADVTIFDEAHALAAVATEHLGATFSEGQVTDLCRDTDDALAADSAAHQKMSPLVATLQQQAAALFHALECAPNERRALDVTPHAAAAEALAETFDKLARGMTDSESPAQQSAADRARRLAAQLRFVLMPSAGEKDIYARMLEERARTRAVRALPLSVAEALSTTLFADAGATILTSATLSVAGSFDIVRERLGVTTAQELVVNSPFSFAEQALLFVPNDFPEPADLRFTHALSDLLVELCLASQGGAFLLFTSLRMMRLQAAALKSRLPFTQLVQGDAPKAALLERFVQDGSAVLFASQSFWEGVDVPGRALRLVCIDKLPFGSPGDPLLAARLEQAERDGKRGFELYQLPDAILSLRQGFGRLIRTTTDNGVVALCDVRLRRKGYGRKFFRALPPAPLTEDIARVRAFFTKSELQPPLAGGTNPINAVEHGPA